MRRAPARRRPGAGGAVVLTALVMVLALPSAAPAAPTQSLATLQVRGGEPPQTSGAVVLKPGATYRVVMSGSISTTFPYRDGMRTVVEDALYCYDSGGTPIPPDDPNPESCRRDSPGPALTRELIVSYTGLRDGPPINEAFSDQHRYDVTFVYPPGNPAAGLAAQWEPGLSSTYGGQVDVELFGEPSAAPVAPGTPPLVPDQANSCVSDARAAQATTCIAEVLARQWGAAFAGPFLRPGDVGTVVTPLLRPGQRSVTLQTDDGSVVTVLSEENARFRSFARHACLVLSLREGLRELKKGGPPPSILVDPEAYTLGVYAGAARYIEPCLLMVDKLLRESAAQGARAAATRPCGPRAIPIRVGASNDPSKLRITVSRKAAPRALRVRCRRVGSGFRMTITARNGGALRPLVGKRLVVGLARPSRSTRSGRPRITFRR